MHKKGIAFIFLAGLLAVMGLTSFKPKHDISFYENRALAKMPAMHAENWLNGQAEKGIETYISDHFALRSRLLKGYVQLQLALHVPVINNIVIAGDTLLPYHAKSYDSYDQQAMQDVLAVLSQLRDWSQANHSQLLYVSIPEQGNAFAKRYPPYLVASGYTKQVMQKDFRANLQAAGIPLLDMEADLGQDLDLYYAKTDHHYNLKGAYETYRQILRRLQQEGMAVPEPTPVAFATLAHPIQGSRARELMGAFQSQDPAYTFELETPIAFTRQDNGQAVEAKVFADNLQGSYSYYMGGDIGETIIQTNRPELPKVLLIGDSFSNALETILYTSFDEMRSLDFRHYNKQSVFAYLETYKPDVILIIRDDTAYLLSDGNGAMGTK